MAVSSIAAFWVTAALLIVVPGADWAFIVSAALRGRVILQAVSGLVLGYAGITAVVAAGVGALVAGSPALLTGLAVIGGLYLMWLGVMTFAHPSAPPAAYDQVTSAGTGWSTVGKGVGVSGLNPKGLLIFFALLPQFTDTQGSWPVAGQIGVLGLVFTVSCAAFYLTLGSCARLVLNARPSAARSVSRFSGIAMVVIGLLLIAERVTGIEATL
ncbi:MAG TPA: LysE family translocator [Streptomyces sp.]|nr:LysE family translocator [Streptomyces sp.]